MLSMDSPVGATLAGLIDRLKGGSGPELDPSERMDGKTVLVTGANSGLGKAAAIALARRGAHVIMACRSGIPEAGEEVRRESGSGEVEMLPVDLASFASVTQMCGALAGRRLDVLVLNAGVVPRASRRTEDGFELMFQVNYLANVLLVRKLRSAIPPAGRIVIVSSESHRSGQVVPERLGEWVDYGALGSMKQYSHTKLCLTSFARELARREPEIAVHALCPGAVNTNVAREAPAFVKPLLKPIMRLVFNSPELAARPLVQLACARALEGRTGVYLHMMREKEPSPAACDPELGRRLYEASQRLLDKSG
jgi:NAD(P)-dependent dehydrogenase (short-subunit alcohol dehydrogenase family)